MTTRRSISGTSGRVRLQTGLRCLLRAVLPTGVLWEAFCQESFGAARIQFVPSICRTDQENLLLRSYPYGKIVEALGRLHSEAAQQNLYLLNALEDEGSTAPKNTRSLWDTLPGVWRELRDHGKRLTTRTITLWSDGDLLIEEDAPKAAWRGRWTLLADWQIKLDIPGQMERRKIRMVANIIITILIQDLAGELAQLEGLSSGDKVYWIRA